MLSSKTGCNILEVDIDITEFTLNLPLEDISLVILRRFIRNQGLDGFLLLSGFWKIPPELDLRTSHVTSLPYLTT